MPPLRKSTRRFPSPDPAWLTGRSKRGKKKRKLISLRVTRKEKEGKRPHFLGKAWEGKASWTLPRWGNYTTLIEFSKKKKIRGEEKGENGSSRRLFRERKKSDSVLGGGVDGRRKKFHSTSMRSDISQDS